MLEMADVVPEQIVAQMRSSDGSPALRRAAGSNRGSDSPRGRAVELARSMGLSARDADEVAVAVLRIMQLDKRRRSVVVELVQTLSEGGRAKR
jgi:hypothetical protein